MIQRRVEELQREFDEGFARPAGARHADSAAYLLVRASGVALALPARALRGLEKGRAVVPLPGARGALLGVAGVRGQLVPAYGLGPLVSGAPAGGAAWLALASGRELVGLAFDELVGLFDVPLATVRPAGDAAPPAAAGVLAFQETTYWVLEISKLLDRLAENSPPAPEASRA